MSISSTIPATSPSVPAVASEATLASPEPSAEQKAVGERLTALTGGAILVQAMPRAFIDKDAATKGHLYLCMTSGETEDDFGWLDDRRPEPMERQLADSLYAIGDFYHRLAAQVLPRRGRAIDVAEDERSFAVAVIQGGRLTEILNQHVTVGEATAFCRAYNSLDDDRQAVVMRMEAVSAIGDNQADGSKP